MRDEAGTNAEQRSRINVTCCGQPMKIVVHATTYNPLIAFVFWSHQPSILAETMAALRAT